MERQTGYYEVLPQYLPWTVAYWDANLQSWQVMGFLSYVGDGFFRDIDEEPMKLKHQ